MSIDIKALSPEQRAELIKQAQQLEAEDKQKLADDKKAFKELSGNFVKDNIGYWITHNILTSEGIQKLWNDFKPLQELKANIFGTKVNEQDSHTSTLEDGTASLTIGYNVTIGFDGTESSGVLKIKEFLSSLSTEDENNVKLSAAVNTFLRPNVKTGMLNPSKIIELSKLKEVFKDERFNEGLQIIFDAQQKRKNSMYVEGWQIVEIDGRPQKQTFRFTV